MADGRIVGVVGPKAQTDQRPAIRHQFGLPAVVGLILPHRHLCLCVPLPAGSAREVFLADQCVLNLGGPIGINGPLSVDMADFFLCPFWKKPSANDRTWVHDEFGLQMLE